METLKAAWVLIPILIYLWFSRWSTHSQRETATAYFWLAIIAIGLCGVAYSIFTTGGIGSPCCSE